MEDASKITVNGTTYNVKDTTARDAASTALTAASAAQTTAAAKLSDAPSDGKEYLRKNGAWAEPSGGGGSGVPDGGTIGQVLAKNSDTDGDAGWYSLRHLPSDKWYLPDGILESDVIAAYQFVGRLDEAEALINVNDGAEYPLSKVLGTETWSTSKGFYIPPTWNAGLNNAGICGQYINILSGAFGYSGGPANSEQHYSAPGIMPHSTRILELNGYTGGYMKAPIMSGYSGVTGYNANALVPNGVLAGNWETNPQMYRDGEIIPLVKNGNVVTTGRDKVFGIMNTGGSYSRGQGYVTALVLYRTTLSSYQHFTLANNIRALGGID